MSQEILLERFFELLINGDRPGARTLVRELVDQGTPAPTIINNLYFPVYEKIEQLHRADQITGVAYHLSTRLLRMLVDQTSSRLPLDGPKRFNVLAACGPSQSEELAAQMAVDLLEAGGCKVAFTGGGVPADEILEQVHERRPDYLVLFASAASDLPDIRMIIDSIREIGAAKRTKIVVGGGVFNRAEGLADQIRADLWATTPLELVDVVLTGTCKPAAEDFVQPRMAGATQSRTRSGTARRKAA
ncbi:MAG: cobalamin-dependent protein [Phycisphaeraceae bacterium]|nr:cobalamin-dependent protein [Phycisphaeraceae bacterium]